MTNSLKVLFSLSFLFLYFIAWTQNNDTIFENQLYLKLKSLDNISESSWKAVENSPNNISSSIFSFGDFLDSIGLINIKQPFGKKKNAEKLYLTFLLEFTDKKHDLNKIIKDLSKFSEVDYSEPKFKDFEDYIPNDPSYSSCWHLNKIQANLAWDLGVGSS
ncbi:MAG: hypothetical protein L7S72_10690, partial [Flavobacteriales bacterium]|nr:hypothetical protein [Flavobacteriales bacterium]